MKINFHSIVIVNHFQTKTHRAFTRVSALEDLQNVYIEGVSVQMFSSKRPKLASFTSIVPFSKNEKEKRNCHKDMVD